jgi:adenosine deaminase
MATVMEALAYKDWIIGVGLDSDERDNPPSKLTTVFEGAAGRGLHAHDALRHRSGGEHRAHPPSVGEIGVDRIDHGTNIVESPALVAKVKHEESGSRAVRCRTAVSPTR